MNILYFLKIFTVTELIFITLKFINFIFTKLNIKETVKYKPNVEIKKDNNLIRFLKSFENTSVEWNSNIDELFHDRKNFENNIVGLEKVWASRKVIETTERGNIIMYYNVFNECFSYYSDQSGISYDILNRVAMKYVLIFRCRDFFIDERLIPLGYSSPFIEYINKDEELENVKKTKVKEKLTLSSNNSPFAKLKNRNSQIGGNISDLLTDRKTHINTNDDLTLKKYVKNKFNYLGKFNNCELTHKIKDKQKELHHPSFFLSYKEYKNGNKYMLKHEKTINSNFADLNREMWCGII
jgi:hypothetical protein